MLVLQRRKDEQITIGNGVVLTILGVRNGVVKVGIDAPKELPIYRTEKGREVKDAI